MVNDHPIIRPFPMVKRPRKSVSFEVKPFKGQFDVGGFAPNNGTRLFAWEEHFPEQLAGGGEIFETLVEVFESFNAISFFSVHVIVYHVSNTK